jgi:putative spermidine/putrescine transport system substrate-binding protein
LSTTLRATSFALTALVSLCLGGCGESGGGDEPDTLVVQSWGGELGAAEKAAFYDPFTEKTGIKVKIVESGAEAGAQLKKQIDSGRVTWDLLVGFPPETMSQFNDEGLLQPIDYSEVPTADELSPGAKLPYAMGYDVETAVPAFSTRSGVKPLGSMKDFFDPASFPGPRMAPNWGTASMQCEMALIADGVPADQLYPIDQDRCFEVWDRIKTDVEVWFTSGSQMAQALVDDSVDYCMCWDGRVQQALATNDQWDYRFDGAMSYYDYMGIAQGSEHADEAAQLLEFVASAEAQAAYAELIKYGPANPAAVDLLPELMKTRSAVSPENLSVLYRRPEDKVADVNAANEQLQKAWDSWVAE